MVTVDPDELSVTSETGSFTAVKSATLEFDQVVIDLYFENGSGWTDNKTGDINALRMLADEQSGTIYFENAEIEFSGEGFLQAYSNARALCE